MDTNWITVFEAIRPFQAELMKNHLDAVGIESIIINKTDSSYGGVVDALCKALLKVHKEDEQKAREILKKYNE